MPNPDLVIQGEICESSVPPAAALEPLPPYTCEEIGQVTPGSGGKDADDGCASTGTGPASALLALLGLLGLRRRRQRGAR